MLRSLVIALAVAVGPGSAAAQSAKPPAAAAPERRDGARDFDFEFGAWTAKIARRVKPLTGSSEWAEYEGVSTVRPVWGGKANLGELKVSGPAGAIEGMSLRTYNPATRLWAVTWVNSADGQVTPPLVGGFDAAGRGEFHNQDTLGGRPIFVRFQFQPVVDGAFRLEQAFSADAGRTWEVNWIADFKKVDQ